MEKSQEILVSVVMVSYNQKQYIAQAIESVLSQKVDFCFEFLIGDDCSTDGTADIIQSYVAEYPDLIHFIRRKKNIGATRNAYELMCMCRGDFIAYIEGDDYWTDFRKLQKQTKFLQGHPEYFGCTSAFSVVNNQGEELKHYHVEWVRARKIFTLEDYDGFHLPSQSSTYFRRNIYKSPCFDYSVLYETDKIIGDRISTALYLLHGNYYRFDEKMVAYRIPNLKRECGSMIVYSETISALKVDLKIYQNMTLFLKEHNVSLHSDYAVRRVCYDAWFKYLKTGDKELKSIAKEAMRHTRNAVFTKMLFLVFIISKVGAVFQRILYKKKLER